MHQQLGLKEICVNPLNWRTSNHNEVTNQCKQTRQIHIHNLNYLFESVPHQYAKSVSDWCIPTSIWIILCGWFICLIVIYNSMLSPSALLLSPTTKHDVNTFLNNQPLNKCAAHGQHEQTVYSVMLFVQQQGVAELWLRSHTSITHTNHMCKHVLSVRIQFAICDIKEGTPRGNSISLSRFVQEVIKG